MLIPKPPHKFNNLLELVQAYSVFQKTPDCWEFGYNNGRDWEKLGMVTAHHAKLLQELETELKRYLSFETIQKRIQLNPGNMKDSETFVNAMKAIREILAPKNNNAKNKFPQAVWSDEKEMWPLYGAGDLTGFICGLSPIFGIVTTGVHLNLYKPDGDDPEKYTIYVARRSDEKSTFPGAYDQCAAGGYQYSNASYGLFNDKSARECLGREVKEELTTSLSAGWLKEATSAPPIQYAFVRDERWGEAFINAPEFGVKIPFDLEVAVDPVFKLNPQEVKIIEPKTVKEIIEILLQDKFKPNSALVMIDFLIRHGCLEKFATTEGIQQMIKILQTHTVVNQLPHWNGI